MTVDCRLLTIVSQNTSHFLLQARDCQEKPTRICGLFSRRRSNLDKRSASVCRHLDLSVAPTLLQASPATLASMRSTASSWSLFLTIIPAATAAEVQVIQNTYNLITSLFVGPSQRVPSLSLFLPLSNSLSHTHTHTASGTCLPFLQNSDCTTPCVSSSQLSNRSRSLNQHTPVYDPCVDVDLKGRSIGTWAH